MFGYVRPVRPELKCRDFDLYQATYCGLCRCLRRRYGLLAPMFLNYDFTFLALLLWQPEEGLPPAGAGATPIRWSKSPCARTAGRWSWRQTRA